MTPNIGILYQDLFRAYKKAHPTISSQQAQLETNKIWNDFKKIKNKDEMKNKQTENTKTNNTLFCILLDSMYD